MGKGGGEESEPLVGGSSSGKTEGKSMGALVEGRTYFAFFASF